MKRLVLRSSLAGLLLLLGPLGCGLGLLDELNKLPVCDGQATDPECVDRHPGSTSSGAVTPTTSGAGEGILTSTVATLPDLTTDASTEASADASTGGSTGSTTEVPPAAAPMIVKVKLDPDSLTQAAAIALQVQTQGAAAVTMALDGAEPISLTKSDANVFTGAIEVYGSSMNGEHTLMIEASNAGLFDTQPAYFTVDAPSAGQVVFKRNNELPGNQTRAIAVDLKSNVYEVGTLGDGANARMGVSKRDIKGNIAWPGTWLSYHATKSRGEDVAVGPDGMIYVLGNVEDKNHTRWWLAKLNPDAGATVGEPEFGEFDEPARGLSVADNGDLAIVGYMTVWGKQDTEDVQTKVWIRPVDGDGVQWVWPGYSPEDKENAFAELPEDILIDGKRIFVVGSVEGHHPDAEDQFFKRKRLFVFEMNFKGELARPPYIAGNEPARSGGYALAIDGKGGVVTAGWKCGDVCTQEGDIRWFSGELVQYDQQNEEGKDGPAYALDIAYSPAGYNVVASAVTLGTGSLGLRVRGYRANEFNPVLEYVDDTKAIEMGQAVAVGPHGYIWFGGLRFIDNVLRAVIGRLHP